MARSHCTCEYEHHKDMRWLGNGSRDPDHGPEGYMNYDTFHSVKEQCIKELIEDPIKMIDRYLPLYPLEEPYFDD